MGLLSRLFKSKPEAASEQITVVGHITGPCRYEAEVVGESKYQDALQKVAGEKDSDQKSHFCVALIVPEPSNPFDKNACAIFIDGMKVGYLPRLFAADYVSQLKANKLKKTAVLSVDAEIVGGWRRRGSEGNYGVKLDLKVDS